MSLPVRVVRSLRTGAFFTLSALWCIAIIVFLFLARGRLFQPMLRIWAWGSLTLFRVRVDGPERTPLEPGRRYVLCSNHRSHLDIFALALALPDVELCFVAKRELERVPIFGAGLKLSGQILVDRDNTEDARRQMREAMASGSGSVVFFAEGTRSAPDELAEFKKGAAVTAIQGGMPLVPVAIAGSGHRLERHSLLVTPGVIRVRLGQPIDTAGLGEDDREALTAEARERVGEMLASLESEANRVRPAGITGSVRARV